MSGDVDQDRPVTQSPKLYPLVITQSLEKTKEFYVDRLGWELAAEMNRYLQLRFRADEEAPEISFVVPGTMPSGPDPRAFHQGLILSIPLNEYDQLDEQLRTKGGGNRRRLFRSPLGLAKLLHQGSERRSSRLLPTSAPTPTDA